MFDLTAVQAALRGQQLDGWLLYDFRGLNMLAARVAGTSPKLSRRWAYFIPATGAPEVGNAGRGVPFAATAWTSRIASAESRAGRDGRGRCLDNVSAERLGRGVRGRGPARVRVGAGGGAGVAGVLPLLQRGAGAPVARRPDAGPGVPRGPTAERRRGCEGVANFPRFLVSAMVSTTLTSLFNCPPLVRFWLPTVNTRPGMRSIFACGSGRWKSLTPPSISRFRQRSDDAPDAKFSALKTVCSSTSPRRATSRTRSAHLPVT